jgi:hypothetical protein
MRHNFVPLIQVMLIKIFPFSQEFTEMREQGKVSSLQSALPNPNFLHESSDGIVVDNDLYVPFLQL